MLYRCCCCTRGCAVAFKIPRKCGFISPCPLRSVTFLENMCPFLFPTVGRQETWHTHANTQMLRPWPSQKEELDVRLLLYRGRHKESLRVEVPCDTDIIQQQQQQQQSKNKNKQLKRGVSIVLHGSGSAESDPVITCPTLNAQSTRPTEPGRGPISLRLVYTRPPCVPHSREHEERTAAGE